MNWDDRLERDLRALAPAVFFPPTPDLTDAVSERLRSAPERRRSAFLRTLTAVAVALAVLAGLLVTSPGARRAVADWLGIGGVRIRHVTPAPSPTVEPDLEGLGDPVSLAEARAVLPFDIKLVRGLGEPDDVFIAHADGFDEVAIAYDGRAGLPSLAGAADIGLVLVQFEGRPDRAYFEKLIDVGEPVEAVTIGDARGFWVRGPHELSYRGPNGTLGSRTSRFAANTLVWEADGITYRLECDLSRSAAIGLAERLE